MGGNSGIIAMIAAHRALPIGLVDSTIRVMGKMGACGPSCWRHHRTEKRGLLWPFLWGRWVPI